MKLSCTTSTWCLKYFGGEGTKCVRLYLFNQLIFQTVARHIMYATSDIVGTYTINP